MRKTSFFAEKLGSVSLTISFPSLGPSLGAVFVEKAQLVWVFSPISTPNLFSSKTIFFYIFCRFLLVMGYNQGLPRHLQDGARPRREPGKGLIDCEICGATGKVFESQIDGTTMYACARCAGDNKKTSINKPFAQPVSFQKTSFAQKDFEEPEFVQGFGKKIRQAREQKKLTIQELALELRERESVIQKLESEKALPSKDLAKKIEKFFGFRLIE